MSDEHGSYSIIANSVLTATFAMIPDTIIGYAEKAASVLVLAMIAEVGRRAITWVWRVSGGRG